jgi:putative membrane protein
MELTVAELCRPGMAARALIAGFLMACANLVPGVSGGTMILVMGLYERFVNATANITRLKFRAGDLFLAALMGIGAVVAVIGLVSTVRFLVSEHRGAMFSLFIGLTLGGAPLLIKITRPFNKNSIFLVILGVAVIAMMAMFKMEKPEEITAAFNTNYALDAVSGLAGIASMVLPGISGAYMLLLLGRYESVLGAIETLVNGDMSGLHVMVPFAIGAGLGLIVVSNALKWLLQHREKATHGCLLGILLGSVIGLWPFGPQSVAADYALCAVLAVVGFLITTGMARLSRTAH